MKFINYFKRGLCILMAVIVLALSPIGSYMDTQSIQTVQASGVALGGSLLFQMISGLYGVRISDNQLDNEYNSFKDYLASELTDVKEYFESITPETITIIVTARLLSAVNQFLDFTTKAQGLVNGITGGSVSTVNSNAWMGSGYQNTALDNAFRNYINTALSDVITDDCPAFYSTMFNDGTEQYYRVYVLPSYNSNAFSRHLICEGNYLYIYSYYKNGSSYASRDASYVVYGVTVNPSTGAFYEPYLVSSGANIKLSDLDNYFTYIPLRKIYSESEWVRNYSESVMLENTYLLNGNVAEPIYTVTGSYSTQNIANITDKELTASQVISINNAVNQGFADNTAKDEDGNLVFTDDMANVIADLVAQKLIAEGIVSNENTGDNTGENTGGNTGAIDISSIVDVLQAILSQIMGLTAVGGYFDKVINGLDKIGLWDIDVWFTNLLDDLASISATIADIRTGQVSIDDIKVNISDWLISIDKSMTDFLSRTWTIDDFKDWFATTQIGEKLDAIRDRTDIKEWVDSLKDAITNTTELGLLGILQRILSAILSLPLSIAQAIMDLLSDLLRELFVPDTTAFEQAVNDLRSEFGFADSVMTIWDDIFARLQRGNEPPKIYIHFENSEDERFRSIGKMLAIDFAWYEKYKPFGDSVISAILWAFFLLRLIKGIPNILRGASTGDLKPDVADPDINTSLVVQNDHKLF